MIFISLWQSLGYSRVAVAAILELKQPKIAVVALTFAIPSAAYKIERLVSHVYI